MALQTLTAIDVVSALKVGAVAGLIVGVIMAIIILAGAGIASLVPGAGALAGVGIVAAITGIIVAIIAGAIEGAIAAIIYNYIIAKLSGGLKIELK